MGEFKPTESFHEGHFDASVEKPVSEADAMLLEQVLKESGIEAHDLEDPNRAVEINKILNEEVESLANASPKSTLNDLLRKGRKLGLPLITAAAILIGAGCAKEKNELSPENQQTSSMTIDKSNNENNNITEVQEVGVNPELRLAFFQALLNMEHRNEKDIIKSKESLDLKKIGNVTINDEFVKNGVHKGDWINVSSNMNPEDKYQALHMGVALEFFIHDEFVPEKLKSWKEIPAHYLRERHATLYEVTYSSPSQHLKGYMLYHLSKPLHFDGDRYVAEEYYKPSGLVINGRAIY